jgi:hypothetical protein
MAAENPVSAASGDDSSEIVATAGASVQQNDRQPVIIILCAMVAICDSNALIRDTFTVNGADKRSATFFRRLIGWMQPARNVRDQQQHGVNGNQTPPPPPPP